VTTAKAGTQPATGAKLGLALSGGGFRAAFFHLGVLRRLAELDLLRYVSVLSTVSGGSILGACYILHLKHRFEASWGALTRRDYEETVEATESALRRGVRKNLRTRLLMTPWWNLRMLCTDFSWGRRMARLYQRHLFRDAARRITPAWARGAPLQDLKFRPPGKGVGFDVELHNREATTRADPTLVPKWVINATSLNTGRDFRFTMSEIGDPALGSIRFDEIALIVAYKRLLETARRRASSGAEWFPDTVTQARNRFVTEDEPWIRQREAATARRPAAAASDIYPFRAYTAAHLYWWVAARAGAPWRGVPGRGGLPGTVFALEEQGPSLLRALAAAQPGLLRDAKIAAWYLRDGLHRDPPVSGGYTRDQHVERFWGALRGIQEALGGLRARFSGQALDDFAELVIDVYYFRSAESFGWAAARELEQFTLADAVAASANFPPVFNPFSVYGLYDPATTPRVALTDGGVYDNLGLSALLEEECTHLIVSDAGGTLAVQPLPATGRISMMARIGAVLMADVRDRQLRELRERRRPGSPLGAAAFFEMASDPSAAVPAGPRPPDPHPDGDSIAQLRTDLDAFNPVEIEALIYQGYQLADRFVRTHLGPPFLGAPQSAPPPLVVTAPQTAPAPVIARVLRVGRRRLFRAVALFPLVRWALIAVAVALVALLATRNLSIEELARRIGLGGRYLVTHPFLYPRWEIEWTTPKGVFWFVVVMIVGGFIWIRWPGIEAGLARLLARRRHGSLKAQVEAYRVARWVGQWRWNLWWPLGLAPLWAALGVAAAATTSFLFDLIPVRRR
jgi:predicted acylesterase/phospholipase RssA